MKKLSVLILLLSLVGFSCKKKTKKQKETTPVEVVPVVPDEFSVRVDDTLINCKTCSSSYFTGGVWGVNFAPQNSNGQSFNFSFETTPKTGSYELRENSNPGLRYKYGSTFYNVTSGVLNITALDTAANGSIKKLTANFTAKTDTTYGPNYRIFKFTKGLITIDYK